MKTVSSMFLQQALSDVVEAYDAMESIVNHMEQVEVFPEDAVAAAAAAKRELWKARMALVDALELEES